MGSQDEPRIKPSRKALYTGGSQPPGQATHAKPDSPGLTCVRTIPGDKAVTSTESGGVQLEDGRDVTAFGHRDQGVHHLFLDISQPAARGVLIRVHLRRKGHRVKDAACGTLHSLRPPYSPQDGKRNSERQPLVGTHVSGQPHKSHRPSRTRSATLHLLVLQ